MFEKSLFASQVTFCWKRFGGNDADETNRGSTHQKSRIVAAGETCKLCTTLARGAGIVCWSSAGLVVERLRVRIPAEAEVEVSSPELPLCADSYSVSVTPPCYRSGTKKTPVILPKVQEAGYT